MDAPAAQQDSVSPLKKFLTGAGALTKVVAGVGTVALGVAFLAGLPVVSAAIFGGIALAAGGRQAWQGVKTLAGKTEDTKPGWKSRLAKAADSLGVGWTGALSFFIGGFALGMGSTAVLPPLLVLGGAALMAVGSAQLLGNAYTAVRDTIQNAKAAKAQKTPALPAPNLSPAPKVGTLEAQPGFEKAASPEAKVEAPAPKPVNVPTPPRP